MPNLQKFITGAFPTRQNSNSAQPCPKDRFLMNESPKSVIKRPSEISTESASSESMDHCVANDLNPQHCCYSEDLTSDESSTCSSFKQKVGLPKISTEIGDDQTDILRLKTLLQVGSCEVKDAISTSGGKGVSLSDGLESRAKTDLPSTIELHDFTNAGSANVNKYRQLCPDPFLTISSLPSEYLNTFEKRAQVAEMLGPNLKAPPISTTESNSYGEEGEAIRQKAFNGSQCCGTENTKYSESPRSASRYSKMQDTNASSINAQNKGRSECNANALKNGRFPTRSSLQVKGVKQSPIKPSPSKWDDAQKWLISSISTHVTAHSQADVVQLSSPKFRASLPSPNESAYRNRHSSSDQNIRMFGIARGANKLETPLSQGSPRHTHAPDKHITLSQEYVLNSGGIPEKSFCGNDHRQKSLLEVRTTKVTDACKPSVVHPSAGSSCSPSVGISPKADTEANVLKIQRTPDSTVSLSTGQRPSIDFVDPPTSERGKHSNTGGKSRASSANMISCDIQMTDKYADTVVQTPDRVLDSNEFLVQTPKIGSSLPMKDVSTEVSPPVSRYRDMGTQMTPLSSSRPSKCTTPISNISPARHNTPAKQTASSEHASLELLELQTSQLIAKLEQRDLSLQSNFNGLERSTSNTWSTREEEEEESSKSLRYLDLTEIRKSVIEAKAAAWEEAERARSTSRYNREESKIQVWENHQKAKVEAEMRKLEVKLEKIRSHQMEKIMNKLAAAHRQAENMRAAAQAEQAEQLAKCKERANQMRISGHVPTPFCACFTCRS